MVQSSVLSEFITVAFILFVMEMCERSISIHRDFARPILITIITRLAEKKCEHHSANKTYSHFKMLNTLRYECFLLRHDLADMKFHHNPSSYCAFTMDCFSFTE